MISYKVGRPRGFSLIEILLVAILLVALGAGLMTYYAGSGKTKPGQVGTHAPREKAYETECISNLRSVRQAIEVYRVGETEEKFPASLDELRDIQSIRKCAVGSEPYLYNPQTGEVHCQHPGHEKF